MVDARRSAYTSRKPNIDCKFDGLRMFASDLCCRVVREVSMKMRMLVAALAVLALPAAAATATAAKAGNSGNAMLCQKGGWQTLYHSDGVRFANQGDCVSYAAHGGALTTKSKSQLDCEALGGTFSTDPETSFTMQPTFIWSCNNGPSQAFSIALTDDCGSDAVDLGFSGGGIFFSQYPPFDSTCAGF
jgi:hypothetical protein